MNKVPERTWQARCETRWTVELTGKARWNVSLRADVSLLDISLHGCQISFGAEPMLVGTAVFIRPADSCTLRSAVRWSNAFGMGLEFDHPLHPAVLEHLVTVSEWTYLQRRAANTLPRERSAIVSGSERR